MHALYFFLVLILAAMQIIHAVEYTVTDDALKTPGGVRFRDQIGDNYAKQTLESAAQFIWKVFQQNNPGNRKNVQKVSLFVEDIDGVSHVKNDEIHVSARYVNSYKGDVKIEITGILYHEMTHIWQWKGNGKAPGGLIEGMADFMRLKANYASSKWVKPGEGKKWDQGFEVTAHFLDYCDSLKNGFVAELNKLMKSGYSDQFFVQLLGKTVDQLWKDYKAKYGQIV